MNANDAAGQKLRIRTKKHLEPALGTQLGPSLMHPPKSFIHHGENPQY